MNKIFTKALLLSAFVVFIIFSAKAQTGYNYSQYDIGTSVSFNTLKGDAQTTKTTEAINFNLGYNPSPFTNFVFEAQLGKLTEGDSLKTTTGRYSNNDFYAFVFRGQLQFGEFLRYDRSAFNNALKNLYLSVGVGYIHNHITQINRFSYQIPDFYTGGYNSSSTPFIPLRIGYEFKLYNQYDQPSVKIDLAYEYNYSFGDLDGFTVSPAHNDTYSQISLGVKFAIFGDLTSHSKKIPY
jgi:hypothetical protein